MESKIESKETTFQNEEKEIDSHFIPLKSFTMNKTSFARGGQGELFQGLFENSFPIAVKRIPKNEFGNKVEVLEEGMFLWYSTKLTNIEETGSSSPFERLWMVRRHRLHLFIDGAASWKPLRVFVWKVQTNLYV
jgi:hypothetical protein